MSCIEIKKENIGIGNLILINPDNLLKTIRTDLVSFNDDYKKIKLEENTNEQLRLALKEINAGSKIVPVSGYRTVDEQVEIYESSLKDNGEEFTRKFVALPNASEHQTGLAIDLALNEGNIDFICPSFPYHGICQEFRRIAPKFGFIERYKDEKKSITKISKEEWHFRYVGYPHSRIIEDKGFCLEEYIDYLKQFIYPNTPLKYEQYRIFYIPYKNDSFIELDKNFSISGNNVDGFILTIKEENNG